MFAREQQRRTRAAHSRFYRERRTGPISVPRRLSDRPEAAQPRPVVNDPVRRIQAVFRSNEPSQSHPRTIPVNGHSPVGHRNSPHSLALSSPAASLPHLVRMFHHCQPVIRPAADEIV